MHSRVARAALALGILALSSFGAIGRACAVEAQKADPDQCGEGDKACIKAWYKEYSSGLLGEFKYYAGQEDFLSEMLADPQETLLTAKLSLLLVEGGTRYSQWVPLKDEAAARNAGLDMARYGAILGPCRDAIAGMRSALFDLRQHRDNARIEAGQYLKNASACEKAFALPATASKLRGRGPPARAPLAAPSVAPQGPMDITPGKPQP
jgi:hypothetical protein